MSPVSIHRNRSIFYRLWHQFFNKIRNFLILFLGQNVAQSCHVHFLFNLQSPLITFLLNLQFLGIAHKFSLSGFQKPFFILIFGIRFLYNVFYGRWINWCGRIFWNRRSRPINIKFYYSKSSLRLKYICQISIPKKELSIFSKIT